MRWLRRLWRQHWIPPEPEPPVIKTTIHLNLGGSEQQLRMEAFCSSYSTAWIWFKAGEHDVCTVFMSPAAVRAFALKHGLVVRDGL